MIMETGLHSDDGIQSNRMLKKCFPVKFGVNHEYMGWKYLKLLPRQELGKKENETHPKK